MSSPRPQSPTVRTNNKDMGRQIGFSWPMERIQWRVLHPCQVYSTCLCAFYNTWAHLTWDGEGVTSEPSQKMLHHTLCIPINHLMYSPTNCYTTISRTNLHEATYGEFVLSNTFGRKISKGVVLIGMEPLPQMGQSQYCITQFSTTLFIQISPVC